MWTKDSSVPCVAFSEPGISLGRPEKKPKGEKDGIYVVKEFRQRYVHVDEELMPEDVILVAGEVTDGESMLKTYVFNLEAEVFYSLNSTPLATYPNAVEWMDFNPSGIKAPGHFAAVGTMQNEINIYNLNSADTLKPAICLGSTSQTKKYRHDGAVFALSWNFCRRQFLASGSADQTVLLWDLSKEKSYTRLDKFNGRVQGVQWHPLDPLSLLTGVSDGEVKLFDLRFNSDSDKSSKTWQFNGEVLNVIWNYFDTNYFFASTEYGMVHYVDCRRAGKPVWSLKAHHTAVEGLALGSSCQDFLVTSALQEGIIKVWDLKWDTPEPVMEQEMDKIGMVGKIKACPESPYLYAIGGEQVDDNIFKLWDARKNEKVVSRFKDRALGVDQGTSTSPGFNMIKKKQGKKALVKAREKSIGQIQTINNEGNPSQGSPPTSKSARLERQRANFPRIPEMTYLP